MELYKFCQMCEKVIPDLSHHDSGRISLHAPRSNCLETFGFSGQGGRREEEKR